MIEDRLMVMLKERGLQAVLNPRSPGIDPPNWCICFSNEFGVNQVMIYSSKLEDQHWLDLPVIEVPQDAPKARHLSEFLKEIDRLMMEDMGMTHGDCEDYNWVDEFDSEVDPEDAYEEWKIHTEGGTRSPMNM